MALCSIVILIITGIIVDKIFRKYHRWNYIDSDLIPMYIILPVIGTFCVFLISAFLWNTKILTIYEPINEYKLEALNDSSTVNFTFLGKNSDIMQYVAGIWTDDGIRIKTYELNRSYINYTEEKPKLVVNRLTYKMDWLDYFLFNHPIRQNMFYIPKDSVISEYSIDFK